MPLSTSDLSAPAVLARFYAAETLYMATGGPRGGDFSGMAATLAPDIILHQSPDLPYGGMYHGHDGFRAWAEEMGSYFEELDVQDRMIFEAGGPDGGMDSVIVQSTLVVKARGTGETRKSPFLQIMSVEAGKICKIQPFYWDVKGWGEMIERGQKALKKS